MGQRVEQGPSVENPPDPDQDHVALRVYAAALERDRLDLTTLAPCDLGLTPTELSRAVERLLSMNLVRAEDSRAPLVLSPVCPDVAAAGLIGPLSEQIHLQRQAIGLIEHQLDPFRSHYDAAACAGSATAAIAGMPTGAEVRDGLRAAALACRREFLGCLDQGADELAWVAALAARGVRVRLLVPHALRADLQSRVLLNGIVGAGGEVGTVGSLPQRLLVFDDEAVFLLEDVAEAGPSGVVIRHHPTIRLMHGMAESMWSGSQPYCAGRVGYQAVADDLQRAILDMMARGLTDEVIARRLGISVRTCRRHIASILAELRAVSRFQAGALALATGLVQVRQSPPAGTDRTGAMADSAVS